VQNVAVWKEGNRSRKREKQNRKGRIKGAYLTLSELNRRLQAGTRAEKRPPTGTKKRAGRGRWKKET